MWSPKAQLSHSFLCGELLWTFKTVPMSLLVRSLSPKCQHLYCNSWNTRLVTHSFSHSLHACLLSPFWNLALCKAFQMHQWIRGTVPAFVSIPFLFKAKSYLIVFVYCDGHLVCFYLLAIVNDTALNPKVQISVQVSACNSFEYITRSGTRSGIARSYIILCSIFWRTTTLFSTAVTAFYHNF